MTHRPFDGVVDDGDDNRQSIIPNQMDNLSRRRSTFVVPRTTPCDNQRTPMIGDGISYSWHLKLLVQDEFIRNDPADTTVVVVDYYHATDACGSQSP